MTLVVYGQAEQALYADNMVIVDQDHYSARPGVGTKLYLSDSKHIAVGFVGWIVSKEDVERVMGIIELQVLGFELGRPVPAATKAMEEVFLVLGDAVFMVMSSSGFYVVQKGKLSAISVDTDFARGSGSTVFHVCRMAGMNMEAAYLKTAQLTHTVGALTNTVKRSQLKPITAKTIDKILEKIIEKKKK